MMPAPAPRKRGGLIAALALMTLSACSVNPATGRQDFTAFMSPAREQQIGRAEHPKILKQFGGAYKDAEVRAYIDGIGRRLARTSDLAGQKFTFTILNSSVVNAFALPGGFVYVTRGLMALADTEAELAGVIAHEIGHIAARHTAQRYSQSIAVGLGAAVIGAVVGIPGAGDLANLGAELYLKGFSRDQEFEADLLGVRYLARSGYHTGAMASFLGKLRDQSRLEARIEGASPDRVDRKNFLATHPRAVDRVARATIQAQGSQSANPRIGRLDHMQRLQGLLYGGDPVEGFIKGGEFIHPVLKFRFQVPPGFRLINNPNNVVALGPEGARIIFDIHGKGYGGPMTAYLRNTWVPRLNLADLQSVTIGGMAGATAAARVNGPSGPADARFVVVRGGPKTIYRFVFMTRPQSSQRFRTAFRRTTFSLRRLSAAEARAARPRKLVIRAVKDGDTVASLSRLMAFDTLREARFRVLNGLPPGRQPAPGQLVKIVIR